MTAKNQSTVTTSDSNSDFDATLSNIIRGIQYSVSTLYETSQKQFEEFLENFFENKDGVLFSKNIDININGSTTSIPIITLFPTNFMSLSKVVVEFEGEVVSINPKTNSLNRRRSSFIIKKNTQNRPMKISTEFIANDQTESYKRIVEKFSNMDIVHGN